MAAATIWLILTAAGIDNFWNTLKPYLMSNSTKVSSEFDQSLDLNKILNIRVEELFSDDYDQNSLWVLYSW